MVAWDRPPSKRTLVLPFFCVYSTRRELLELEASCRHCTWCSLLWKARGRNDFACWLLWSVERSHKYWYTSWNPKLLAPLPLGPSHSLPLESSDSVKYKQALRQNVKAYTVDASYFTRLPRSRYWQLQILWVFSDNEVFKCRAAQRESQISEKHSSSCFVEWKYEKLSIQQPQFVIVGFYSIVSYSYRIDVDIQARFWSVPLHHTIEAVNLLPQVVTASNRPCGNGVDSITI